MYNLLKPEEIVFDFNIENINVRPNNEEIYLEYENIYEGIKRAIDVEGEGYNLYLIDSKPYKEKILKLKEYIENLYKSTCKPPDICYVTKDEHKRPKVLFLKGGNGILLKEYLKNIKEEYLDFTSKFYNDSVNEEKENITEEIALKEEEILDKLIKISKEQGFELRFTGGSFNFIPVIDGTLLGEEEYENIEEEKRKEILTKVKSLKHIAKDVLGELKDNDKYGVEKLKDVFEIYLRDSTLNIKAKFKESFIGDEDGLYYLDYVCSSIEQRLVEGFNNNLDEEKQNIIDIFNIYNINVLVNNSNISHAPVIYEKNPTLDNLLGYIERSSQNESKVTDIHMIKAGSLLKANNGCIIIKIEDLINNPQAYYELKRALICEEVDFNYNLSVLDLLTMRTIKPNHIPIKVKVILVGDWRTYELLFNYDKDFKELFKLKEESKSAIICDNKCKENLIINILAICKSYKCRPLTNKAVKEVARILCRTVENRNKVLIENSKLKDIILLANNYVNESGKHSIEAEDIIKSHYNEEEIEKEIKENFKEKKIIIKTEGAYIGMVNGISVIDLGHLSFGKPIRITCSCCKGHGDIIDVQKESGLSGSIHQKSINILKGLINFLIGGYTGVPINFYISFEQVYSMLEGDSASVGEAIAMVSALSKIPVKQNIAVTGSINQFGEIQPIGGVNEKIEGFYNTCMAVGDVKGHGVLIPYSNINNLILNREVEESISKGEFTIYTMETLYDAMEVLMGNEGQDAKNILEELYRETRRYAGRKDKKS